jgi:hypothetical protein
MSVSHLVSQSRSQSATSETGVSQPLASGIGEAVGMLYGQAGLKKCRVSECISRFAG